MKTSGRPPKQICQPKASHKYRIALPTFIPYGHRYLFDIMKDVNAVVDPMIWETK